MGNIKKIDNGRRSSRENSFCDKFRLGIISIFDVVSQLDLLSYFDIFGVGELKFLISYRFCDFWV
jgi:hypothetical protein